jgi:hypothetical protein
MCSITNLFLISSISRLFLHSLLFLSFSCILFLAFVSNLFAFHRRFRFFSLLFFSAISITLLLHRLYVSSKFSSSITVCCLSVAQIFHLCISHTHLAPYTTLSSSPPSISLSSSFLVLSQNGHCMYSFRAVY